MTSPTVFGLQTTRALAERVAQRLGSPLAPHEERPFEDGEHKARPLASVRDRDVYVVHALYGEPDLSPDDKLCRLLFFCGALRDAGAARVNAVIPYLCYARKERKTKPRDPVTTRYVASCLEAVGVDRVVALDVHELGAFQNAYRIRTEHLEARPLFLDWIVALGAKDVTVVSPDVGGIKRAQRLAAGLTARTGEPVALAFMEKRRSAGVVSGEALVGDVHGRVAVVIDDLVASGTTLARAAGAARRAGATQIHALATHGLFVGDAGRVLGASALDRVVVTSSIPSFRLDPGGLGGRLEVLDIAPLLAEAIARMASGGSLVDLVDLVER